MGGGGVSVGLFMGERVGGDEGWRGVAQFFFFFLTMVRSCNLYCFLIIIIATSKVGSG